MFFSKAKKRTFAFCRRAFFWLLSLLLTSLVWLVTGAGSGNPLHDLPALALPVSVLLQELFRWLLYRLLKRADKVLEVVSDDSSPLRRHKFAYGEIWVWPHVTWPTTFYQEHIIIENPLSHYTLLYMYMYNNIMYYCYYTSLLISACFKYTLI